MCPKHVFPKVFYISTPILAAAINYNKLFAFIGRKHSTVCGHYALISRLPEIHRLNWFFKLFYLEQYKINKY